VEVCLYMSHTTCSNWRVSCDAASSRSLRSICWTMELIRDNDITIKINKKGSSCGYIDKIAKTEARKK